MIVWNGRLPGGDPVGVALLLGEAGAAVVQRDPRVAHRHARAEALEDRLDPRHRVALAVDRAQVGRAAAGPHARVGCGARPDPRAQRADVGQLDRSVADRARRPVERELGRLDVAVQVAVELLGDPEGHERGRSLRVGRQLADLDAAVRAPQRRHPFGAVRGEVVLGEPARRGDRGGDRPLVDRVGPAVGDRLQRRGEVGQAVALARPRGGPRRPRLRRAPVLGDPRRGRHAVARRVDRAGQRGVEPEAAEALGGVGPRPHGAGHRDRARPGGVDGQRVDVRRRAPRAVEPVQLAVEPQQREGVAADAVVGRLADGEHGRRRERGVDRVAARLQRPHARARGQRVAGGHHRLGGDRRQAGPARGARRSREQPFVQHRRADVSGAATPGSARPQRRGHPAHLTELSPDETRRTLA